MAKQITTLILFMLIISLSALPLAAQSDTFQIAYGDTISNGVPAPGAGNIETGGAQDVYTFQSTAGDEIILDSLLGTSGQYRWLFTAPDGTVLFDTFDADRRIVLSQTGEYSLAIRGNNATFTGVYSLRLALVPPPQEFAISIGDTVSDGVPAAGAGNLEVPGALDIYRFDGVAGEGVIFDALVGTTGQFRIILTAPDGTQLFNTFYLDQTASFSQTGIYTLSIQGLQLVGTGVYSFQLLSTSTVEEFTISIGDTVSDGLPVAGAGNLEAPGSVDVYRFEGAAGQGMIFDALAGTTGQFRIVLFAPDGTVVLDTFFIDEQVILPQTGTYSLRINAGQITGFGAYSFHLIDVPPDVQEFTISIGDTVSDGVPEVGAGNLETPGSLDVYRFEGMAGQSVIFDALVGTTGQFRIILNAPDGTELFNDFYLDQQLTLPQTGTYSLTIQSLSITGFGTYSFTLLEAPMNSSPVANDDTATTDEDSPITISVLSNDTDADGDSLTITSVTQPANGILSQNAVNVTYTPNANFNGTDSFTYSISDGNGGFATATVTVTVNPVNDDPVLDIITDSIETDEGQIIVRIFSASDVDGDPLTFQTTLGQVDDLGGGSFQWSYFADDGPVTTAVSITVDDGQGGTASGSFDVVVRNIAPTATFVNTTGSITAPGAVTLTFSNQQDPGSADTNAGFLYSYDCVNSGTFMLAQSPSPGFDCAYNTSGTYTALGRIEDKDGGFTDYLVEVVVEGSINNAPDAQDDTAITDENLAVTIPVLTNDTDLDGDALIVISVTQAANGATIINGTDVTYTPNPNFSGLDSFTYTISDGRGGMDTATVTVTVNGVIPVNHPPVSNDDSATTDESVTVTIDVLANDSDADGDSLIVSSVTQAANGIVTNNGSNVVYTPNSGFSGTDTFTYTASDPSRGSDTALVTVTVLPTGTSVIFTLTLQVNRPTDDVNEDGSIFSPRKPTVWIGNGSSAEASYLGLRFNNVTIPYGAIVEEAYIEVYAGQSTWINLDAEFAAEATASSATFRSRDRPSQRPLTAARVAHNSNVLWTMNTWNRFDDITSVIQEVIGRGDWHSGNSLSVIVQGTGRQWGRKFFTSYDGDPAFAPRLVIRYNLDYAQRTSPDNTSTPLPAVTDVPPVLPTVTPTDTPAETVTPEITPTEQAPVDTAEPLPTEAPTATPQPTATPSAVLTEVPTVTPNQEESPESNEGSGETTDTTEADDN